MHERSLVTALVREVEAAARRCGARNVVRLKCAVSAQTGCSLERLREHFAQAAHGTVADGARLDLEVDDGTAGAIAPGLVLEELEVEEADGAGNA